MVYYWIKQLHIFTVVFTICFFVLRLYWMRRHPEHIRQRWVRMLSATNDATLFFAGLAMVLMSHQYPFVMPWLTTKLFLLLLYILLGSMALKYGKTPTARTWYGIVALGTIFYIVSVALSRSPLPWTGSI
jgi:uncharacterized membrane protein SirB2